MPVNKKTAKKTVKRASKKDSPKKFTAKELKIHNEITTSILTSPHGTVQGFSFSAISLPKGIQFSGAMRGLSIQQLLIIMCSGLNRTPLELATALMTLPEDLFDALTPNKK